MPVEVRALEAGLRGEHPEALGIVRVTAWDERELALPCGATHFGVALAGRSSLSVDGMHYPLAARGYFAIPRAVRVSGGKGLIVSQAGYRGLFQLGGPVEATGRLRYIDGCSDTLLISPARRGDPCLNLLHVPPETDQTAHTHPSVRVGIVLAGAGLCRTPEQDFALLPGSVFELPAGAIHSFHTAEQELLIVAYHPDSDFGPTDQSHPMLNKTFVGGRSLGRTDMRGGS